MTTLRFLVAFAVVVFGVASTVGSGGGENLSGPTGPLEPPPPIELPSVDITSSNAQGVAATVVQEANEVLVFGAIVGGQIFPALPSAPDRLSGNSKFGLLAAVITTGEPVSETCAVGGTVTVSGYPDNDPVSLSEQDSFDLVFDTCDDGDGYSLDGDFSVIVDHLMGDPRTDVFAISYELHFATVAVAFSDGTRTASHESSFRLAWDSLDFPVTVVSVTPDVLQLTSQADVYTLRSGIHSQTVNADTSVPTTLTEVSEAQLGSRSIGGSVVYETTASLRAPDGQDPDSGEMLVSPLFGDGTVRIVIESSASVRLDIDLDGDGIVDDFQYTSWSALLD